MILRPLILVAALAACSAPLPGTGPAPVAGGRLAAECRLLEAAHDRLQATGRPAPPDILVGCPGHEGLRDAMPLAAQSAALRRANAATLPAAVAAAAPLGPRVYRRMISRGVPESLAADLARGPVWRAATDPGRAGRQG